MNQYAIFHLSGNEYAVCLRQIAEALSFWSGLLLIPFLIYHMSTNEAASIFSLGAFFLVLSAEIIFVVMAKLANLLLASVLAGIALMMMKKGEISLAQNVQSTTLALFGVGLCISAWFFSDVYVDHWYVPIEMRVLF